MYFLLENAIHDHHDVQDLKCYAIVGAYCVFFAGITLLFCT